jgi:hypothetical protein
MGELRWSEVDGNPSLAPLPVAQRIKTILEQGDPSLGTLQKLRAIGSISARSCDEPASGSYRCTYWLWESGRNRRGIQVDIAGSDVRGVFVKESRKI